MTGRHAGAQKRRGRGALEPRDADTLALYGQMKAAPMTRAAKRDALLSLPCPDCEAPQHVMCRRLDGHQATVCHAARYDAAFAKGLLR